MSRETRGSPFEPVKTCRLRPLRVCRILGGSRSGRSPHPGDPHEADRIEMALNCGEELIRRKREYGTELGMFMLSLLVDGVWTYGAL